MENPTEYKRPRTRRCKTELSKCQDCESLLTDDNWSPSMQKYKRYTCKSCWTIRQLSYDKIPQSERNRRRKIAVSKWSEEKRKKESDRSYFKRILTEHGLTKEQYELMIKDQNNSCAICNTKESGGRGRWHVDHCHSSGKVRGLLCKSCNLFLGLAKDNINILTEAISYLRKEENGTTD